MIKFDLLDRLLTSGYTRIPNPALEALYSNAPCGKGMTLTYILFLCKVLFASGSTSMNKKVYNCGIGESVNNQRGIANLLQTALSTMRYWLTKLVIQGVIKVENLEKSMRITVVCYEAITGRKGKEVVDEEKKLLPERRRRLFLPSPATFGLKTHPSGYGVGSVGSQFGKPCFTSFETLRSWVGSMRVFALLKKERHPTAQTDHELPQAAEGSLLPPELPRLHALLRYNEEDFHIDIFKPASLARVGLCCINYGRNLTHADRYNTVFTERLP